jgi:sigma-B regulation protein RsbU (phosphoserine phosphatase)
MPGREEGRRSALVVTQQPDLGAELAEAIEDLGLSARVVSGFDLLESHADVRPWLVITDLALKPSDAQWNSLTQLFPRSALWAVIKRNECEITDVIHAFRCGCHDCLSQPVTRDDIAEKMAAIGRTPGARFGELDRYMSNEIRLELPSDVSVIEHVIRLLAERCRDYRSYSQRTLVNLRIAVSEALSNAIRYGNRGDRSKKLQVRASVDAWTVKVQVTDEGPGFDPHQVPDPTSDGALEAPGGRGLFLLRRLVDDVTFNETGNSVTLTLKSDWEAPEAGPPRDFVAEDVEPLIDLFQRIREASGADLHLWAESLDGSLEHLAPVEDPTGTVDGALHWLRSPGVRCAVQVRPGGGSASERWAEFARDLLDDAIAQGARLAETRRDLAERQEEIELLHSITETLGAVTRLEDAAGQILRGVVRVTGADRASLWIYDAQSEELVLAASEGGPPRVPVDRVPVSHSASVSALAFREKRTVRLEDVRDLPPGLAERLGPKPEPWVAVPVSYTSPGGVTRIVGVLNLIGRRSGSVVSHAGETRLLMTLARQIGSAVENLRLFEGILSRERLIGELQLAHDLQMKLLPELSEFSEVADAAARCVPARPVGGDFYQLFKLADGKIGAMLGDVTSHGFGAALIMALSMSVTGIYAHETASPGELLKAIHRALIQKLESAEMFMTVFYGVIDPARKRICYANAGHAHAFRLHADEQPLRLMATSPPLGIAEYGSYGEASVPWEPGDLLCLFTDGLTNPSLRTTERAVLEAVGRCRDRPPAEIVDAMFEARGRRGGSAPDDQTAFVLRA